MLRPQILLLDEEIVFLFFLNVHSIYAGKDLLILLFMVRKGDQRSDQYADFSS